MIELKNLQKFYSKNEILNIKYLHIAQGEFTCFTGSNGCGKSTLLRILALLDNDYLGEYFYNNTPIHPKFAQDFTLLLQEPYLLAKNVYQNIAYGLKIRHTPTSEINLRIQNATTQLGLDLEKFAKRRRYELSGGEKQRVALASRLVLEPKILLLDEPTASVDKQSANLIADTLVNLHQAGTNIILVSHDYYWVNALKERSTVNHLHFTEHGQIEQA